MERPKPPKRRMEPRFYAEMVKKKQDEQAMRVVVRDFIVYFCYVGIVFMISYVNRDPNSFWEKNSIEQSIVYGGVNCEVMPTDDPRYRKCKPGRLSIPWVRFDRVRDVNEW